MPITLEFSPAVTQFLAELVKTGSFASESEYVGTLIERAWLDREVVLGKEQAEHGEFVDTSVDKIIQTGRSQLAGRR